MRSRLGPTLETLLVVLVVFGVQRLLAVVGIPVTALLALSPRYPVMPWTLVTSVYAHETLSHLLANAVALVLLGIVVERGTTRLRFHAFFVTTGAVAGLAEVVVTGTLGSPVAVLGASGAVFALLGYAATGNRLSNFLIDWVDLAREAELLVYVVVAVALTLVTAASQVALIAHFTGLLVGLVAGRARVLSVRTRGVDAPPTPDR